MKMTLYPHLQVAHIKNPNRLWAIPFFGIFVKVLIVIPQAIELVLLCLAVFILSIINSFVVLIEGKNMKAYVDLLIGTLKLTTKLQMFIVGLTDKYPGFSLENDNPNVKLEVDVNQKPNRLYAIPVLGGVARVVLLIPFFIWGQIIRAGAQLGVIVSFAPVLFTGKYPETTYELFRDYTRLQLSSSMFIGGLQDNYPKFDISKNHMVAKIVLIALGLMGAFSIDIASPKQQDQYYKYRYGTNSPARFEYSRDDYR